MKWLTKLFKKKEAALVQTPYGEIKMKLKSKTGERDIVIPIDLPELPCMSEHLYEVSKYFERMMHIVLESPEHLRDALEEAEKAGYTPLKGWRDIIDQDQLIEAFVHAFWADALQKLRDQHSEEESQDADRHTPVQNVLEIKKQTPDQDGEDQRQSIDDAGSASGVS